MSDFGSQVLDDAPSSLFLLLGGLDKLPGTIDFLFEEGDRGGILLSQAQGGLDSGCVANDGLVELLASFNQAFL